MSFSSRFSSLNVIALLVLLVSELQRVRVLIWATRHSLHLVCNYSSLLTHVKREKRKSLVYRNTVSAFFIYKAIPRWESWKLVHFLKCSFSIEPALSNW